MRTDLKAANLAKPLRDVVVAADQLNAGLLRDNLLETGDLIAALDNERRRLAAKHGDKSRQVVELDQRLAATARLKSSIEEDLERATLPLPKISSKEAIVFGRVVDLSGQGIAKLDVILQGQPAAGETAPPAVKGVTGKGGHFELRLVTSNPVAALLEVRQSSRVLHRDRSPMSLEPRTARFREISVDTGADPPKPTRSPVSPQARSRTATKK